MAAPYSNLLSKAEKAIVGYLVAQNIAGYNFYAGRRSGLKVSPACVVWAKSGIEEPLYSGNYRVQVEIRIEAYASPTQELADPKPNYDTQIQTILDKLKVSDLDVQLSTVGTTGIADFTVQGFHDRGISGEIVEDTWHDTLHLEIYCSSITMA